VGTAGTQPSLRAVLGLVGAAILTWYAARTLRSAWRIRHGQLLPDDVVAPATALRTGVIATASNPLTIISWAAIFGGATTLAAVGSAPQAVALIAGIAVGSLAWHLGLAVAFGALGRRIGPGPLVVIDVVSGTGLAAFAILLTLGVATTLTAA
jgi:threonine/homoserine/homoserine lactone efflux protein